jgi:pectinesterase
MRLVRKGDYVMIQFGHNDESCSKIEKYTDPDTTFQENLKKFIKEVRDVGGIPILVTPPIRLIYDKNSKSLKESHVQNTWHAPKGLRRTSTTYHDAVRKVSKETNTLLLDLNKKSLEAISSLGSYEDMKSYYRFVLPGHKNYPNGISDTTHFSIKGAALMAKLLSEELRRIGSPLKNHLKSKNKISVNKLVNEFNNKNK